MYLRILSIALFAFISNINGSKGNRYRREESMTCPAADLISPCVCTNSPSNLVLCDGVNNIETLQHALANRFNTPIPTLEIKNAGNLFLPHHSFEDIPIKRLIIEDTSLKINTDALIDLDSMESVALNNVRLRSVPINVLRHVENIETLSLAGNSITYVEKFHFSGLKRLKTLILDDNKISYLPSDAFPRNLESLSLSDNGFNNLQESYFNGYPNLKSLSIARNNLESIRMLNMRQLNFLNASGIRLNSIREITYPGDSFKNIPNLEELDLSDNGLGSWFFWPDHFKKLKVLNLAKNKFREVDNDIGKLTNLEILDVSQNYIGGLTDVYGPLEKLKLLNIEGNRIGCNAHNKAVIEQIQRRNVEVKGSPC